MLSPKYLPGKEEGVKAYLDRIDSVGELRLWFMINNGADWFNEFHALAQLHPKICKSYRPSMGMMEIVEIFEGSYLPVNGQRVVFSKFHFTDFSFVQTSFFASIIDCCLDRSDFTLAKFGKSEWAGGSCQNAKMQGITIDDCEVTNVDFCQSSFQSARFENSIFKACNFSECCFDQVKLNNVDLSQSNLNQKQIYCAIGDVKTKIPSLLKKPSHWNYRHIKTLRRFGDYIHIFSDGDELFYNESSDQQAKKPLKRVRLGDGIPTTKDTTNPSSFAYYYDMGKEDFDHQNVVWE